MNNFNKIYVIAPHAGATGGIELAHQLVDHLRNKGKNAYIVYVSNGEIVKNASITEVYNKYNISVASNIEDKTENVLVLSEIFFEFIYSYSHIQIACWWMSVDNRYNNSSFTDTFLFRKGLFGKIRVICRYFLQHNTFKRNNDALLKTEDSRIVHFYQSIYAQNYLYKKGFSRILPLSDYINTDFTQSSIQEKEDIILYNPAKGYKYTKKLISMMPDYNFVKLKGLSRKELVELMGKAKLYIDFGNFPGKDRLPREAILSGCCILTGKEGASYYFEDVAIPEFYKIEAKRRNLPIIKERIDYILKNYSQCVDDMCFYKRRIKMEKEVFIREIDNIFM